MAAETSCIASYDNCPGDTQCKCGAIHCPADFGDIGREWCWWPDFSDYDLPEREWEGLDSRVAGPWNWRAPVQANAGKLVIRTVDGKRIGFSPRRPDRWIAWLKDHGVKVQQTAS